VMENQLENPRVKIAATIKSKGDKFRVDVNGGPRGAMSTILDTSGGEIIQLEHERKEARKIPGEILKQRLEALKKNAPPTTDTAPPKATGEKEKIGDWECEIYTWEKDKVAAKLWVATNIPKTAEIKAMLEKLKSGGLGAPPSGPDTTALPGVVVKTETATPGGKSTMTIGSIKEQNVDAAEFEVPAGYEMKLPPVNPRTAPSAPSGAPGIEKKAN
jgi:hypothetical protein